MRLWTKRGLAVRPAPRFLFYLADTARAVITVGGVRFSLNPKLQVAVRRLESLDDAENDIDEGGDVGNVYFAVAIDVGTGLIFGNDAKNHVN